MEIRQLRGKSVVFCCDGKHCRKQARKIRKEFKDVVNIQLIKTGCMKKCGKCPVFFWADATGGRFLLEASAAEIKALLPTK